MPRLARILLPCALLLACGPADPEDAAVDLFACAGAPVCDFDWSSEVLPVHVVCAGDAIESGEPGLLLATETIDPGTSQTERLIWLSADGTALVQTRQRPCEGDCDAGPWGPPSAPERCDVAIDAALLDACRACATQTCLDCSWIPEQSLTNCAPAEAATCDDLQGG